MRLALAIVVAGVAVANAVYFGSLKLNSQGHYHCVGSFSTGSRSGYIPTCRPTANTILLYVWTPKRARAVWQLPLAIVIAAVGFGAAVMVARGAPSSRGWRRGASPNQPQRARGQP